MIAREGSYALQILRFFKLYGAMSQTEATRVHGMFGLEAPQVRGEYTKLFNKGYLLEMETRGVLSITASGERLLESAENKRQVKKMTVTPPRTVPDFQPLQKKYTISPLGTRPGSNDYREWSSHYAPNKKK